ncbi:cupredoxin domain-containing protein [Geodermatophilus ruber]|uniref:Copper binding protein, plastocyanin/azurin family n=1 Tax=Geodermatophilus ruber TaxID=504800 RepID=A0A1I4GW27_9ACTN|nr:cupredoxin domain-containing protein [Geodermatophilus ruber]SFL33336.1 Copper binding protein, plastocyanin/azurin family [Geodermatophilus ruber]
MPAPTISTSPGRRRTARRGGALVLALALGFLGACSDGGDSASSAATSEATTPATSAPATSASPTQGAAESQTITATEGEMFIRLSADSFAPGTYSVEVTNEGSATHDLVVERDGQEVAATDSIAPGQSATLTVTLEPGDYVFYCSIGNHRAMGMEAPVTVTA